mmetsp:Transcript_13166/g.31421  ORF Transcript_13166/g.31421 Transcript_13166/m.31421 type:complete len:204 (-) Transcript_13166:470-1081(-)
MPVSLFNEPSRKTLPQKPFLAASKMEIPMLAMLAATMPTSTVHWTPTPICPCAINRRRESCSLTVWSPSTLILLVVSCGGVGVQVAAAKEAVAASSPITDTRPVTPTEHRAFTFVVMAQLEAANANFVAALPTHATKIPPSTWHASSLSPSRGAGQVRMMALMSSPMPTTETKASMMLNAQKMCSASWIEFCFFVAMVALTCA